MICLEAGDGLRGLGYGMKGMRLDVRLAEVVEELAFLFSDLHKSF